MQPSSSPDAPVAPPPDPPVDNTLPALVPAPFDSSSAATDIEQAVIAFRALFADKRTLSRAQCERFADQIAALVGPLKRDASLEKKIDNLVSEVRYANAKSLSGLGAIIKENTRSYAQIARAGVTATPEDGAITHNTPKTARFAPHHRVILNCQDLHESNTIFALSNVRLHEAVSPVILAHTGAKVHETVRLASKDIAIIFETSEGADSILMADNSWLPKAFPDADTLPKINKPALLSNLAVVVHGVPAPKGQLDPTAHLDQVVSDLESCNNVKFTNSRWLVGPQKASLRDFTSIVLQAESKIDGPNNAPSAAASVTLQRTVEQRLFAATAPGLTLPKTTAHVAPARTKAVDLPPPHPNAIRMKVLQINVHRSPEVMHSILNDPAIQMYDFLCLQEPFASLPNTVSHPRWRLYGDPANTSWNWAPAAQPSAPLPNRRRTIIYANHLISPSDVQLHPLNHPDILCLQVNTLAGSLLLASVYNSPQSQELLSPLATLLHGTIAQPCLVLGDFNLHHPAWESDTTSSSRHVDSFLAALAERDLHLLTPRDLGTFLGPSGRCTTIDLAFGCPTVAGALRSITRLDNDHGSDHFAVEIHLDLSPMPPAPSPISLQTKDEAAFATAVQQAWYAKPQSNRPPASLHDLDGHAEALTDAIRTGYKALAAPIRIGPATREWFVPSLKEGRRLAHQARRAFQVGTGTHASWKEQQRKYKKSIRAAKRAHSRQRLDEVADPRSLWKLAKLGNNRVAAFKIAPLQMANGMLTTCLEDKEAALASEFLLPPNRPSPSDAQALPASTAAPWLPFTTAEVQQRINAAKLRSAPGPDLISWRLIKVLAALWPDFVPIVTAFFNDCAIRFGHHPRCFKVATVAILRKPNKSDYSKAGAYRPISLLPVLGKLLEGLVAGRILAEAETNSNLIAAEHYGGRPGRSTEDALIRIHEFIRHSQRNGLHCALVALDVKGAYNAVQPGILADALAKAKLPSAVISWATSFMADRRALLRLESSFLGPMRRVDVGLPQGSPISQLFWLIYSRGMVEHQRLRRTLSIGWVDDKTLLVAGPIDTLRRDVVRALDPALQWAQSHEAAFDPAKSGYMIFSPRHAPASLGDIDLDGLRLTHSPSLKILGVTFGPKLSWTSHVAAVSAKATSALGTILAWGNRAWGFRFQLQRQLYISGVWPIMSYACAVWHKPRAATALVQPLIRVQQAACIRITGCFSTTSTDALNVEASLAPVPLALSRAAGFSLVRWLALPSSHPNHKVTQRAVRVQPKGLQGPLQTWVCHWPRLVASDVTKRETKPAPMLAIPRTLVAPSKQEAIDLHYGLAAQCIPSLQHVYTDGSLKNGVAAFAYFCQADGQSLFRHEAIGLDSTVYRAELKGIRAALEDRVADSGSFIFCNNRAAIVTIGLRPSTDPDVRAIQELASAHNVTLVWIPGHHDIAGNEEADVLAQEAADNALPMPAEQAEESALRRHIVQRTLEAWKLSWDRSPHGSALKAINTVRIGRAFTLYHQLRRGQASLVAQARTGHLAVNVFLHSRRVPGVETACNHCGRRDNRSHLLRCLHLRLAKERLELRLRQDRRLQEGGSVTTFKVGLNDPRPQFPHHTMEDVRRATADARRSRRHARKQQGFLHSNITRPTAACASSPANRRSSPPRQRSNALYFDRPFAIAKEPIWAPVEPNFYGKTRRSPGIKRNRGPGKTTATPPSTPLQGQSVACPLSIGPWTKTSKPHMPLHQV
ncbi:uncharacterized protein MEPE_06629 [Melanopsichium pennsylvanicum]|uniref:Reverse transcriptase n=1 Tax=Melanopsichium pennsylvanicum TaxID=63383 RepID=A0AAJ4XT52_9BASI|nr:uncharacterized protein MEPE_06629 [Melanopsichium pennsylvanicum]